jgi:hypothetical protein
LDACNQQFKRLAKFRGDPKKGGVVTENVANQVTFRLTVLIGLNDTFKSFFVGNNMPLEGVSHLLGLRVFEAGQKLNADCWDKRWPPDHAAMLASMGMVRLMREHFFVDVPPAT